MSMLLFFVFAIALLVYSSIPFFANAYWPALRERPLLKLLMRKKEGIWAITDVDNEHETGKLTDEDHASLRDYFKSQLLEVMKKEQALVKGIPLSPGEEISPGTKKKLLYEVIRICGIKH